MKKKRALIVDLDGTLADIRVRLKHLEGKKKDWKSFNKSIETDELHEWCRQILLRFSDDHKIIIVSGRVDDLLAETKKWLEKFEIPYDHIYLRPDNDHRPDTTVKREIFNQHIRDKFEIVFVLEDRQKVVDMWRSEGLTVLQCAPGNF